MARVESSLIPLAMEALPRPFDSAASLHKRQLHRVTREYRLFVEAGVSGMPR